MSKNNKNDSFNSTIIIPPSLSPTSTIPANNTSSFSLNSKSTVIDLEKNDTYNREEIADAHYPNHYEDTVGANSITTTTISGRFNAFIALGRQFRHDNREILAEFIGTLILVLLINGVCAEQRLGVSANSWLTVAYGNGMAVLFAISICGHISGAHMNPVVTVTLWLFSNFPRYRVPTYIIAQVLGAFCGSAILYLLITPAIQQFDGGTRSILEDHGTANIFATYPPHYVGIGTAIASEVVGTSLLALLVMTTGHLSNRPFCSMQGVIVATGISSIVLSIGYTSGFSLNPARDFGPRVFTALAGWGPEVFTVNNYYAFVPLFAPFLGSLVGGTIYIIFIDHASDI